MKVLIGVLLMASVAWGQDFQQAKILDVRVGSVQNTSALGRWANGDSMVIPARKNVIVVMLALGDLNYTAQYPEQKHFKASDLTIGDSTKARVDGENLILKGSDGKDVKGRITRKERVQ